MRELVNEIVSEEQAIPVIRAVATVFKDEKPEYKVSLDNHEKRRSALYEELDRRDKLYNY